MGWIGFQRSRRVTLISIVITLRFVAFAKIYVSAEVHASQPTTLSHHISYLFPFLVHSYVVFYSAWRCFTYLQCICLCIQICYITHGYHSSEQIPLIVRHETPFYGFQSIFFSLSMCVCVCTEAYVNLRPTCFQQENVLQSQKR